ncbi:transmembrane protein 106A isoform X5 [Chlorocebus sabaeus]|uniref:transmembrane protein 106A isoform X5 n=1 Tax=Chlorocebus sabaeus TaxID=60711 RepID=UPI0018B05916|nr:transmembrane protein 106A isoform X4 [Chlorocebus sabaeus]
MGKTFSQLGSWREDENKSILPSNPAIGSQAVSYFSTGSSKSLCSCVPCEGTAGASFVTCPTCQGSGKIPQELEKQLVALIPYGDQRLKPKHTKLFVFLAVLICLVTSSFIIFFLFPRSVVVQPAGLNSSTVAFDEADIYLNITMFYAVATKIPDENTYKICTWLEIKVHHVLLHIQDRVSLLAQVGLELLGSSDPPFLASQSTWITDVSHCAWLVFL